MFRIWRPVTTALSARVAPRAAAITASSAAPLSFAVAARFQADAAAAAAPAAAAPAATQAVSSSTDASTQQQKRPMRARRFARRVDARGQAQILQALDITRVAEAGEAMAEGFHTRLTGNTRASLVVMTVRPQLRMPEPFAPAAVAPGERRQKRPTVFATAGFDLPMYRGAAARLLAVLHGRAPECAFTTSGVQASVKRIEGAHEKLTDYVAGGVSGAKKQRLHLFEIQLSKRQPAAAAAGAAATTTPGATPAAAEEQLPESITVKLDPEQVLELELYLARFVEECFARIPLPMGQRTNFNNANQQRRFNTNQPQQQQQRADGQQRRDYQQQRRDGGQQGGGYNNRGYNNYNDQRRNNRFNNNRSGGGVDRQRGTGSQPRRENLPADEF
jgi:hypothetical protein